MQIEENHIHIWSTELTLSAEEEKQALTLLNQDERDHADQYRFPIHRIRYIAARSLLRKLLHLYFPKTPPEAFLFRYNDHQKPYLSHPDAPYFQFNLSHSHHYAVYAFTTHAEIGIDIEKRENKNHDHLAKRFFSPDEYAYLIQQPAEERINLFYDIWSKKEAVMKAYGEGLGAGLDHFSVKGEKVTEIIHFPPHLAWTLIPITLYPDCASAVASNQTIQKIWHWRYPDFNNGANDPVPIHQNGCNDPAPN